MKRETKRVSFVEMASEDTFFWIVSLVHGNPEESGIIQSTELVTKKYERVEALVASWSPLIDSGKYYAIVRSVAITQLDLYSI